MKTSIQIPTFRRVFALVTLLLLIGLQASCSSSAVRGESPFAQVTNWRADGQDLYLDLRLRNVNDEALTLTSLSLAVTVDSGTQLLRLNEALALEIPAGGFETIALETQGTDAGIALLESLARKERASLVFSMTGAVESPDEGSLAFQRNGHIYTVPGRPGEFR